MSAVEEIEAAIEKLEALRDASSPAPWVTKPEYDDPSFQSIHDGVRVLHAKSAPDEFKDYERYIIIDGSYAVDPGTFSTADGELIVTLHRTIDAQLAILNDFRTRYADRAHEDWEPVAPSSANVLALARAINRTS